RPAAVRRPAARRAAHALRAAGSPAGPVRSAGPVRGVVVRPALHAVAAGVAVFDVAGSDVAVFHFAGFVFAGFAFAVPGGSALRGRVELADADLRLAQHLPALREPVGLDGGHGAVA